MSDTTITVRPDLVIAELAARIGNLVAENAMLKMELQVTKQRLIELSLGEHETIVVPPVA